MVCVYISFLQKSLGSIAHNFVSADLVVASVVDLSEMCKVESLNVPVSILSLITARFMGSFSAILNDTLSAEISPSFVDYFYMIYGDSLFFVDYFYMISEEN